MSQWVVPVPPKKRFATLMCVAYMMVRCTIEIKQTGETLARILFANSYTSRLKLAITASPKPLETRGTNS